jgi:hypothetical protein
MPWSWYPKVTAQPYFVAGMALTADELRFYDQAALLDTLSLLRAAIRLEDAGPLCRGSTAGNAAGRF